MPSSQSIIVKSRIDRDVVISSSFFFFFSFFFFIEEENEANGNFIVILNFHGLN